jgi:hypothetical protein
MVAAGCLNGNKDQGERVAVMKATRINESRARSEMKRRGRKKEERGRQHKFIRVGKADEIR